MRRDVLERIAPRLRAVCNGDTEVNGLRAELSAAVQTTTAVARRVDARAKLAGAVPPRDRDRRLPRPPKDQPPTADVRVSCFIRLSDPGLLLPRLGPGTIRRGELVTAELTPREIEALADRSLDDGIA
jgi:hypothetical protein